MESMDANLAAGQRLPWHEVWMEVVTHPSRDSFRLILSDPGAGPARAYFWVGILGIIFAILEVVVMQLVGSPQLSDLPTGSIGFYMACLVIATPIMSVVGLALMTAILRGIAGLFGGQGNYNNLVYCLAAIQAPISIVGILLSLISSALTSGAASSGSIESLTSGSMAALCVLPFSLAIGIYSFVLDVLAIDTVEKIGTGKAVLTLLLPGIVVFLVIFGCAFLIAMGASSLVRPGG